MLPKTSAYVKRYDGENEWMYFLIEDDELLQKYENIWNEAINRIKKEFDSKLIDNEKSLKTKIKYYGNEDTDFQDIEIPKADSDYICLVVLSIDFVLKKDKKYCPQVFLKECKYIEKEKFLFLFLFLFLFRHFF